MRAGGPQAPLDPARRGAPVAHRGAVHAQLHAALVELGVPQAQDDPVADPEVAACPARGHQDGGGLGQDPDVRQHAARRRGRGVRGRRRGHDARAEPRVRDGPRDQLRRAQGRGRAARQMPGDVQEGRREAPRVHDAHARLRVHASRAADLRAERRRAGAHRAAEERVPARQRLHRDAQRA